MTQQDTIARRFNKASTESSERVIGQGRARHGRKHDWLQGKTATRRHSRAWQGRAGQGRAGEGRIGDRSGLAHTVYK